MRTMLDKFNGFIQVISSDPEDARRRYLLNVFVVGTFVLGVLSILILEFGILVKRWTVAEASFLLSYLIAYLILNLAIFLINRHWGTPAIYLFLFINIIGFAFSDTPAQIANGGSIFYYAIPIVIASILISPSASFFVAVIGCVIISLANAVAFPGSTPNFVIMLGFFMLALISWLTTRSLDNALSDIRKSHAELDRQVEERTHDLAKSMDREQAEARRSKAILESLADGVIVFDRNGAAIVANPACARLLDMPVERIVGSTTAGLVQSKFLTPKSRSILAYLLANPAEQVTSANIEWAKKTLSVSSACVIDNAGSSLGTVAVFRDYTQAAEVERMKNSFVAIVSHELRTPLNAIFGYTEMLKDGVYGPINKQQSQASDRIMSNTRRMLDIVGDLLDQTQMEAGKLALHIQPFRPSELIDNVHSLMDKLVADRGLVLTCQLDARLPEFILGDTARLQQVLVNLINNAVKFTEKGSLHISLSRSGEKNWSLGVQDTGIGIPEAELATIFEAFRQVDNLATRKYGGFGLGLAIVKQLAELMDGRIAVTSKLGAGTSFIITLPLVAAAGNLN